MKKTILKLIESFEQHLCTWCSRINIDFWGKGEDIERRRHGCCAACWAFNGGPTTSLASRMALYVFSPSNIKDITTAESMRPRFLIKRGEQLFPEERERPLMEGPPSLCCCVTRFSISSAVFSKWVPPSSYPALSLLRRTFCWLDFHRIWKDWRRFTPDKVYCITPINQHDGADKVESSHYYKDKKRRSREKAFRDATSSSSRREVFHPSPPRWVNRAPTRINFEAVTHIAILPVSKSMLSLSKELRHY